MWYIEDKNSTTFNIFGECNQECPFCSGYPKREFNLEKDILSKIKWLREISLQWWEPTMSPFLFDIINYARNNWTEYINLITNGLKISDINFAKDISWKIDCYHFAFMSHKKEKADLLWWTNHTLSQKSRWILNLIKLWEASKIRLVHIIQKDNLEDLEEFPNFINKYFPWITLIEFKYIQYFWNKNNLWKIPKYTDSIDILNKTFFICESLGINFIVNWVPLCFLEERFHKNTASYYNDNSFDKMEEYSTIKLDKCIKCSYTSNCIWIRQDYILLNWDNEFR